MLYTNRLLIAGPNKGKRLKMLSVYFSRTKGLLFSLVGCKITVEWFN
jgi:hypothetical protein